MPAAVVAVSGRALLRLKLVERLDVGADHETGGGVAPIATPKRWMGDRRPGRPVQGAGLGCAPRAPPKRRWPAGRSSS